MQRDAGGQSQSSVDFGCSFILGGQIAGEEPRLFNIYPQGNFIEATPETPYFQIGESKYHRPRDRLPDAAAGSGQMRADQLRFDHQEQSVCRSACRSICCCTAATNSRWHCSSGLPKTRPISSRFAAAGATPCARHSRPCRRRRGKNEAPACIWLRAR